MRRFAALMALALTSVAWPISLKAQSTGVAEYERQSRVTFKNQQKGAKKAAKKQFKAIRKAEKKQRKARKKYQKGQRPQAGR